MFEKLREEEERWSSGSSTVQRQKENAQDEVQRYQQNIILLQGLIDRTDIFKPDNGLIKITDSSALDEGLIRFIYDDDIAFPDNRKPFWDWHKDVNAFIEVGSRVMISSHGNTNQYADMRERLDKRFSKHSESVYNLPKFPNRGVYKVEEYVDTYQEAVYIPNPDYDPEKKGNMDFINNPEEVRKRDESGNYVYDTIKDKYISIKYNPGGEIRNNWDYWDEGHEREKKLSFKVYKEDKFLLNYDAISLEDANFYLNSRLNRREYLTMMPLLYAVKTLRVKELEQESHFIDMTIGEVIREYPNKPQNELRKIIEKNIDWWKLKNKWKRPISEDDTKALRMIKKRILSELKKK